MPLSEELRIRLLGAVDSGSLIFLCGAGLSMPQPSGLPSAARVAQICYDDWLANEPNLAPALRNDVDLLAAHFHGQNLFASVFIPRVPWNELTGPPNKGHAAVADFLISRASCAALSANFDTMIEHWAQERKVALKGALTGQDAVDPLCTAGVSPLLKFHGCMNLDRPNTLWTGGQLNEPTIQNRVTSSTQWMGLHLPGKHIVVVGFWTDWGYLNNVLADAFAVNNAASVTVVDTGSTTDLQTKAPDLWAKMTGLSVSFDHVRASGADFLDELRQEFSKSWSRRYFALGATQANAMGIASPTTYGDTMSCDELYNVRQDGEGVPYNKAARTNRPDGSSAQAAFVHHQLQAAGATHDGPWLELAGRKIRVINGAGQDLATVKESYKEPATVKGADLVICAGANDLAVPAKIIASGHGSSILRPGAGGNAAWMTREQAMAALGV